MDREQEEAIQRITARYVAELHAGKHPRLSDYLSRYPQYAEAITDFVAYYHATELHVPEELEVVAPLSQASRVALDEAWKRVLYSENAATIAPTTLQMTLNNSGKSLSQLAVEVGLSVDILEMLQQRIVDAATIPKEVCTRLAKALQQPLAAIEMYLGLAERKQLTQGIAEAPTLYHMEGSSNVQKQSFRDAIERSVQLPNDQKDAWRGILTKEGL
jgi:hypothetical protein